MNRPAYGRLTMAAAFLASLGPVSLAASAEPFATTGSSNPRSFTATLSNNTPLAFGMDAEGTSRALGVPLNYISGGRGDEIYLAFRSFGGSGLFPHKDRLYLQFRHGRLAGWKGDWGHNWMWQ